MGLGSVSGAVSQLLVVEEGEGVGSFEGIRPSPRITRIAIATIVRAASPAKNDFICPILYIYIENCQDGREVGDCG